MTLSMMQGIRNIYGNAVLPPAKNKGYKVHNGKPQIYDKLLEILTKSPSKRTELMALGFKESSLDTAIKLMVKEGFVKKTDILSPTGVRKSVLYTAVKKNIIK